LGSYWTPVPLKDGLLAGLSITILVANGLFVLVDRYSRLIAPGFLLGSAYLTASWLSLLRTASPDTDHWLRDVSTVAMSLAFCIAVLCVLSDSDRWCIPERHAGIRTGIVVVSGAVLPSFAFAESAAIGIMVLGQLVLLCCARGRYQWGMLAALTVTCAAVAASAVPGYGDILMVGAAGGAVLLAALTIGYGWYFVFSTPLDELPPAVSSHPSGRN